MEARPPNIVVVLVDDLRWDDLGIEGHPFVETPAIDRLAREGARFRNAFATTPLCSPSRATILTGQYAHTNGIVDNTARDAASHQLQTFALPLAAAGWRTGFSTWAMTTARVPDSLAGSRCAARRGERPAVQHRRHSRAPTRLRDRLADGPRG
ncbi:MAG: sulfatase-like hydrolase/transferase [Proteobacteria bacterium]|nr:sulfatase-like hydrolase/transferase [Pseudomonadota bacterium]